MWVYGESQVRSQSRHFDGQHPLGNEITCPTASHADAEYAAGGRIKDEFGDPVRAIECRGPARGPPGEAGYLNGAAFLFGLGFRQATPGISGSVNTTAGTACGSKATLSPAMACTATRPSCAALWASVGSP